MVSSGTVMADRAKIHSLFEKYRNILNESTSSGVWEDVSRDSIVEQGENFVSTYSEPIASQMNSLATAIDLLAKYKMIKAEIKQLEAKIASADKDDPALSGYMSQLAELKAKKEQLKAQIESLLAAIITSVINQPISNFANTSGLLGLLPVASSMSSEEINDLLNKMGSLEKLSDSDNLANYYGEGYIEKLMDDIKNGSESNRQKAIDSSLTLIKLAADKGVKLDYDYGGAHGNTTTSGMLSGADCSSFVSYCLNQGSDQHFDETTATFANKFSGKSVKYADAQPGDILNVNNSAHAHVEMIVENHPDEGYFITAEASSSSVGVKLTKITYDYAENHYGFKAYDMSDVYKD